MVHKFDAKKADILDNPERAKILDPEVILEMLELTDEIVLADLGCGTGFFSIPASKQVKKVFALDIQQDYGVIKPLDFSPAFWEILSYYNF